MFRAVTHVIHQLTLAGKPLLALSAPVPVLFLPLQALNLLESGGVDILHHLLGLPAPPLTAGRAGTISSTLGGR